MEQDDLMMNYGTDPTIQNVDPVTDPTNVDSTILTDPTEIGSTVLDPTVIAVKTRRPQVKLTTDRLLSNGGLPYVMKKAPKSIRISSRKNAQQNLSQVVQFYQLWAHELFPKAKFRDFIKLCETLGKTDKTLREYRSNLYRAEMGINPIGILDDDQQLDTQPLANDTETTNEEPIQDVATTGQPTLFVEQGSIEMRNQPTPIAVVTDSLNNVNQSERFDDDDDDDDDDIYSISVLKSRAKKVVDDINEEAQQPSQYEMDEIMKEMEQSGNDQPSIPNTVNIENSADNDYADDEEAFNDMEEQLRGMEQLQNIADNNAIAINSKISIGKNHLNEKKESNDEELQETHGLMKSIQQSNNNSPDNTSTKDTQDHRKNNQQYGEKIPHNIEEHHADEETDTLIGTAEQSEETQQKSHDKDAINKEEQKNTEQQYMDAAMDDMSAYGF